MNRSKPITVTIVMPAHNEESCLKKTVEGVIKGVTIPHYELLICNDHSSDNTLQIATALSKKYPQIRVISNGYDKGFGNVLRFGFDHATGKYVVVMMADACDDPKTVNEMYAKAEQGYDLVIGSRYIKGGGKKNTNDKFKSMLSRSVGLICHIFLGVKSKDGTNAFRMIRRSVLKKIRPVSNHFDLSLETTLKIHRMGYKITEVPTVWIDRSEGETKFNVPKVATRYIRWIINADKWIANTRFMGILILYWILLLAVFTILMLFFGKEILHILISSIRPAML